MPDNTERDNSISDKPQIENKKSSSSLTVEEIKSRTRESFAPPTEKQLRQQAVARAKGGLSPRGIQEFEERSETIAKKTGIDQSDVKKAIIKQEEKKLGLSPRRITKILNTRKDIRSLDSKKKELIQSISSKNSRISEKSKNKIIQKLQPNKKKVVKPSTTFIKTKKKVQIGRVAKNTDTEEEIKIKKVSKTINKNRKDAFESNTKLFNAIGLSTKESDNFAKQVLKNTGQNFAALVNPKTYKQIGSDIVLNLYGNYLGIKNLKNYDKKTQKIIKKDAKEINKKAVKESLNQINPAKISKDPVVAANYVTAIISAGIAKGVTKSIKKNSIKPKIKKVKQVTKSKINKAINQAKKNQIKYKKAVSLNLKKIGLTKSDAPYVLTPEKLGGEFRKPKRISNINAKKAVKIAVKKSLKGQKIRNKAIMQIETKNRQRYLKLRNQAKTSELKGADLTEFIKLDSKFVNRISHKKTISVSIPKFKPKKISGKKGQFQPRLELEREVLFKIEFPEIIREIEKRNLKPSPEKIKSVATELVKKSKPKNLTKFTAVPLIVSLINGQTVAALPKSVTENLKIKNIIKKTLKVDKIEDQDTFLISRYTQLTQQKQLQKQKTAQKLKLININLKKKTPTQIIKTLPTINVPLKNKLKIFLKNLKEDDELTKKQIEELKFQYTPTLSGIGQIAKRTTGQFTGFELRGSVIKPVIVKRHKRNNLKNKRFVRKHGRRKPKR